MFFDRRYGVYTTMVITDSFFSLAGSPSRVGTFNPCRHVATSTRTKINLHAEPGSWYTVPNSSRITRYSPGKASASLSSLLGFSETYVISPVRLWLISNLQ